MDNFHKKWDSLIEQREMVWSDPHALVRSDEELSIKVLESFNAGSASRVFEKEIHEVVGALFKLGLLQPNNILWREVIVLCIAHFGPYYGSISSFSKSK